MDDNISKQPLPEQEVGYKKYPGPVAAGIFFSLTSILLTYGDRFLIFKNNFLKSGIGEILFVLLPVMIFLVAGKYNIKETLKLRKTKPVNYLIVVFLMLFGMPVVGVLNAVVLVTIRLLFGKNLPIPQIQIPDIPTLFIAVLIIGASAAICEETLFRGVISKGFDRFGTVTSLIITSILFGILHRDIQKGVSTILLGALIGFIVYRTGSIYAGMVAHFTNNTAAVLLTFGAAKMSERLEQMGIEQVQDLDYFSNLPTASLVFIIIFYIFIFIGFTACFTGLFYAFCKSTADNKKTKLCNSYPYSEDFKAVQKKSRVGGIIALVPGLALIALTFLLQLLSLMNVNSGPVYNVLKSLGL